MRIADSSYPVSPVRRAGGMPLGLFKDVRSFTLTATADGEVGFAVQEAYSGLLAALILRSIPTWMALGSADELKPAARGTVERAINSSINAMATAAATGSS